jgi:hypothetical protein
VSEDHVNRILDLLDEASTLDEGPSQVMLLEEAVRLADSHGDVPLGFEARAELIQSCTFGGFPEKALVAFSWCLAQSDRAPDRFSAHDLLWKYKWIVGSLPGFPQIVREQIASALEDMKRRFLQAGAGLQVVHKLQCEIAMDLGDQDVAVRHERDWQQLPRDHLSDCRACEVDAHIDFLLYVGQDERAVAEAEPVLRGELRCAEIPQRTLGRVLLPLLRLGRAGEAMAHHRKGYRMIAGNRKFLNQLANHLTFLTLTGNLPRAVRVLERHLPFALETVELSWRFAFYLAARLLLDQLRAGGKDQLPLRLPSSFPGHRPSGRSAIADLETWFDHELNGLAARFNERNGNDWFSRRIAESQALKRWACRVPWKTFSKEDGDAGGPEE